MWTDKITLYILSQIFVPLPKNVISVKEKFLILNKK